MKTPFLLLSTILMSYATFSQSSTKLSLMQGAWIEITSNEEGEAWTIVKGNKSFSFACSKDLNELDFPCQESIEGFQEHKPYSIDSMNVRDLTDNGTYYTVISVGDIDKNGGVKYPGFLIISYFYCDGDEMSINGGKLFDYTKASKLSTLAQKKIYLRGKQDKRNYLKEYLDIDVREIIVNKSIIYSEPDTPTKMYLIKSDIVTVLEEKEVWLRIEYEGKKLVTGWIKMKDVGGE
jgi:hypothetical protein